MRFREFRATALGTCDKNRTSNGTADVLYVLLRSLTPLGFYSMFFLEAKNEFGRTISREQRGGYMDANEEAKKKSLKSLQT